MPTFVQFLDRVSEGLKELGFFPGQDITKEHPQMNTETENWTEEFRSLFERKVTAYQGGIRSADAMFLNDEENFLRSIGATPREIFDFVEDWCDDGEPDPETVLGITSIRRDYFYQEQQGRFSEHTIVTSELPSRHQSLAGLEWFPRIIEKARAKLRGELSPDLMYSCAGDRRFLKQVNVSPVEFLQTVWEAGDDVDRIVQFVTDRQKA